MKAILTFDFAQAGTLSVPCAAGSVDLRGLQNGKEHPEPQAHIKAHFIRSRFQCKKRKKTSVHPSQKRSHLFPLGLTIPKQLQFHSFAYV